MPTVALDLPPVTRPDLYAVSRDRGRRMSLACVRGCTIARQHLTDCEHPDDGCRGCLPRPAEFGALCIACHYGLVRTLHDLPPARALLAGHLQPSYARRTNTVKATKGDPPVPLNLNVLDLTAEFDHVPLGMGTHPRRGPRPHAAHRRRHALAHSPRVRRVLPNGSPTPGPSSPDLTSRAHALVPWRAEARRMHAPCPHCHCQALVTYGGDEHVTCQECQGVIGAQDYERWVRVVLDERRQAA
jgi:hypothetical protein